MTLLQLVQRRVEPVEVLVFEGRVVDQVPLAARVVVRLVVALARKVQPLRVAEFVSWTQQHTANGSRFQSSLSQRTKEPKQKEARKGTGRQERTDKVEVALAAEGVADEADHLVESHAAVDHRRRARLVRHVRVHFLVHQPKGQRLVANQCLRGFFVKRRLVSGQTKVHLVVRLGVGDGLLHPAPVRQRVDDVAHVPVLVFELFDELDPLVGNGHAEAVVEADATLFHRPAQRRHSGNILQQANKRTKSSDEKEDAQTTQHRPSKSARPPRRHRRSNRDGERRSREPRGDRCPPPPQKKEQPRLESGDACAAPAAAGKENVRRGDRNDQGRQRKPAPVRVSSSSSSLAVHPQGWTCHFPPYPAPPATQPSSAHRAAPIKAAPDPPRHLHSAALARLVRALFPIAAKVSWKK